MPKIRHHRRHHSWPHCGSELCMRAPSDLELRFAKPGHGLSNNSPWAFQQAKVVPLIAEEGFDIDDAEMAGIVRSESPRMHRIWSRPLQRSDRREEIPVTTTAVEARKHVHRSVLRRLIRRPPLDKTRSLFVMPTMMTAGDQVVISGWMPPRLSARPVMVTNRSRTALPAPDSVPLLAERRHRRCHSEQPRAWREPSAGLWTLEEE